MVCTYNMQIHMTMQFDELFSIICELTKFVQDNIDDLTNYFQIQ